MSERFAWIYDKTRKAKIWCADMWSRKAILAIKAKDDASNLCDITPTVPTLAAGSHHATYGGCWYYKIGHRVCVHIGVAGITANTTTTLWQMPAGYIPYSGIAVNGQGSGYNNVARARVTGTGAVIVNSSQAYATVYLEYDAFS
jgi:hypothetical protein